MKNNVKALLLAALMLLSCGLFAACVSNDAVAPMKGEVLSKEATYKITVVDDAGAPCDDVLAVKFMQDGQQKAMQLLQNGVAEKTLERDDYTIELQFKNADHTYIYDTAAAKVTKTETELKIVVSKGIGDDFMNLVVGEKTYKAYHLTVGNTSITLDASGRSYYIFTPSEAGLYEFTLFGSNAPIGYYGSIHFVQAQSVAKVENNKFTVSVSKGNLGSSYVIGVDAGEGKATLGIARIGDPIWSAEDEPWTDYVLKHKPVAYTLPAGTTLKNFDLTATTDTYTLVLNEEDGFYHLNSANGPLVYVRVAKTPEEAESMDKHTEMNVDSNNYLPSFGAMLETSAIRRYFYDDQGKFLKKEDYSENLQTYIACADKTTGLYPLTDDLIYIIQNQGIQAGWWDPDSQGYIFNDSNGNRLPGINHDIAWLFMCKYAG